MKNYGIKEIWKLIEDHIKHIGYFVKERKDPNVAQINHLIKDTLTNRFFNNKTVKEHIKSAEAKVAMGIFHSIETAKNLWWMYDSDKMKPDK
jgi:putative protein kinase ArgK-like GTPase of G3E family